MERAQRTRPVSAHARARISASLRGKRHPHRSSRKRRRGHHVHKRRIRKHHTRHRKGLHRKGSHHKRKPISAATKAKISARMKGKHHPRSQSARAKLKGRRKAHPRRSRRS